jgi:hypothetical protein
MPQPADLVALAATTLARKWKADIDVSAAQDGSDWRRIKGATEVTYNPGSAGLQPDTDYDGEGYASSTATTLEHNATMTVRRAPGRTTPTAYDPGQEFLRGRALNMGTANTAHIRFYEWNGATGPKVEAYEGYYAVSYANGGGDPGALSTATITLTGQGANLAITHPDTTTVVPTVNLVIHGDGGTTIPAAGGKLLIIGGTGFNTVTVVTVFGNVVPTGDWEMLTDNRIALKAPAHAAGSGNITVTNPSGTSATNASNAVTYV